MQAVRALHCGLNCTAPLLHPCAAQPRTVVCASWFLCCLQTFFVDDDLKDACQLDAVLTVVDSKHLIQHLDEVKPADVVNEAGEGPGRVWQQFCVRQPAQTVT